MRVHYYLFVLMLMSTHVASLDAEHKGRFGEIFNYRFDNGLTLIHRNQPGRLRAGIGLVVNIGLRDFFCEQQAAPHLLEHLFFEGTSQFSANQLRQRVRKKAGKANGFTFFEDTFYTIYIHENYTEFAIEHLFHLFTESSFDAAAYDRAIRAIEAERGVSRSYLKSLLDGKKSVFEQTISRAYQGLPIDCDKKAVPTAVSLEKILRIREQYYQPENMTLIVLGNYDRKQLLKVLGRTFGGLVNKKKGKTGGVELAASHEPKEAIVEYRDPANVEADLFMVIPTIGYSHKDAYVVDIIEDYLDEELFKIVRNNLGLGYTPQAKYYSEAGFGFIRAHVQTTGEWIDKAEKSFLSVYERLREEGISPDRLDQLLKTKALSIQSEEKTIAEWLNIHRKSRLKSKPIDMSQAYSSINQERVQEVLNRYFPERPTIGVHKPRPAELAVLHIVFIILASGLVGFILIRIKGYWRANK